MSLIISFVNQIVGNHKVAWLSRSFIGALNNFLGSTYFLF